MNAKNSSAATPADVADKAKLPGQVSTGQPTIVTGVVIDDEQTEESVTTVKKLKSLLRNKKVVAGLSAVITVAVVAVVRRSNFSDPVVDETADESTSA